MLKEIVHDVMDWTELDRHRILSQANLYCYEVISALTKNNVLTSS